MGLRDLSLRVTDAESNAAYSMSWIRDNTNALTNAIALTNRVNALEKANISAYENTLKAYAPLFTGNAHGFIFFTDPHNFSDNVQYYELINYLRRIHTLFVNSPAKYALCGGDLINTQHTKADAMYYLGRAKHLMEAEIGENTYIAVGNHDLNVHQPTDSPITPKELAQLWYEKDQAYYSIDRESTRCFVFDSGSMDADMDDYRWEQVDWFANELLTNNTPHLFGLMHIMGQYSQTYQRGQLGDHAAEVANAFNNRESITKNGKTYDFINAEGTFHFFLAGHYHMDFDELISHVPVIYTINSSIDMCCADWNTGKLHLIRYPSTQPSRVIDFVQHPSIGGLPVLYNNEKYQTGNGEIGATNNDNDFFIAGPFDTGDSASKSYTFSYTKTTTNNSWVYLRVFNDLNGTSIDYWSCAANSENYPGTKTITTPGRYFILTINKETAADMYLHDDTNDRYVFKGANVT